MSGVVSGQRGQFTESSVPVGDYREGEVGFHRGRKNQAEVFAHRPRSVPGAERPRQGPLPHLTRETFSVRRPADGADTLGGVFRPGDNLPGEGDTADIFLRRRRE